MWQDILDQRFRCLPDLQIADNDTYRNTRALYHGLWAGDLINDLDVGMLRREFLAQEFIRELIPQGISEFFLLDAEKIDRLAEEEKPYGLAVSLHAADPELRKRLVPTARAGPREIVAAARRYFERKGREVTFEAVLLAGVNDRPQDASAMVALLGDFRATVNLIPWNEVEEIADLKTPSPARTERFASWLREGGLKVTVRRRRGADRSAACGQLRIRTAAAGAGRSETSAEPAAGA